MTPAAMGDADIRWQQRFSNYCRALVQLEGFFIPYVLNEREEQGLIKASSTPSSWAGTPCASGSS